jgi:hypothetical protein
MSAGGWMTAACVLDRCASTAGSPSLTTSATNCVRGLGIPVSRWREGEAIAPEAEPEQAQLVCLASGELSPFVLELRRAGVDGGWRLRGELVGTLTLEAIDAPP